MHRTGAREREGLNDSPTRVKSRAVNLGGIIDGSQPSTGDISHSIVALECLNDLYRGGRFKVMGWMRYGGGESQPLNNTGAWRRV